MPSTASELPSTAKHQVKASKANQTTASLVYALPQIASPANLIYCNQHHETQINFSSADSANSTGSQQLSICAV